MKKIVVACGSGVATSQNVATRISSMLEDKGIYDFVIEAIDIKSLDTELSNADIYISLVPESKEMNLNIPIFDGIKFLTGMGSEEELQKIIEELERN